MSIFIANLISKTVYFYLLLIIIRVFLTWIPSIDWRSQPFEGIAAATDIYLNLFRKIIPPIGGLDFSPIIAILALQFISDLLIRILV